MKTGFRKHIIIRTFPSNISEENNGEYSRESFKYIKLSMRIAGTRPTNRFRNIYRFYGVFYNINVLIVFPMLFVVNLFFVDNNSELFNILSWCLSMVTASIKFIVLFSIFYKFHKKTKLILAKMDKRLITTDESEEIRSIINFNQTIHLTYFGFCLVMLTLLVTFSLIAKNHLMFPTWFPFDWKTSSGNFFIAIGYQSVTTLMTLFINITTNMIPIMNIIVLTAHTRVLTMRVQLIGNDADKTPEENYTELVDCIEDQGNLDEYFIQIMQIISRSIFVQFIMTAFTMGITVLYLLHFDEAITDKIILFGYLCAIMTEILPCCYFTDKYTIAADYLTSAIFNCNWMDQNPKFKKAIIIFMQHSQKSKVMLAAKLIPVSLHSFWTLLKFSFSLFTVFSRLDY